MASIIKVDQILDGNGNQFDGSQLGNVGKVLQSKVIKDPYFITTTSSSFVTIATISIDNVKSSSDIQIEAHINHLIENSTVGTYAIFKGSTELARAIHWTSGNGGWRQPLNSFIGVDIAPSDGTNTYTIRMMTSGATIYYNYSGAQGSYSYYRLMEIGA